MIELVRSADTTELLKDPLAFSLLSHIALSIKTDNKFSVLELEKGEALISCNDYMGMTRGECRGVLERLVKWKMIGVKSTSNGTVVKMLHYRVFNPFKKKGEPATKKQMEDIKTIIEHLNKKGGKSYKPEGAKTISCIVARMQEGFEVEHFIRAIDYKVEEWTGTEWEKFLRPETLFGTKFEGYLNQAPSPKPKQIDGCVVCGENKSVMRTINGKKHCIDCADML
jgi:uncharacterized phage protein (TIGR02220 family)